MIGDRALAIQQAIAIAEEEERRFAAYSERTTDLYESNEAQSASEACRVIVRRLRELMESAT